MGAGLPSAMAAKLLNLGRKVVSVNGDDLLKVLAKDAFEVERYRWDTI